ncbi:MAG TPA: AAA family ATPase, partial [Acidimicrobiia bacterium]
MRVCAECGVANAEDARFCSQCGTLLASATEERRFLTVLFADLVGFTARSDEADPEDVRARLVPYHEHVRQEINRFGGLIEKLIGDGVMAVFGVPTAHEDDPERAVRAGLRIQTAVDELNEASPGLGLQVRIAINTGEAMVSIGGHGEKIVGDVINTASRLEQAAPPGSVIVGEPTYRATSLLIDYQALEPVTVKGKARPLPIWRAIAPRSQYGIDATARLATPFLGRNSELALLQHTFRRVLEESSIQLVTITGAPGVGKTRLVREFWSYVDGLPEIVWWRQGRCLPYGEGITFWALGEVVKAQAGIRESDDPAMAASKLGAAIAALVSNSSDRAWLVSMLGPLVGTLGEEGEGTGREQSFTAWRRFLEELAAARPLVMVVEDLHWADSAMVEFLEDLLVWSTEAPIMVLCTARPELYETHRHWGGGQRNSTTISLGPLRNGEMAALLSSLLNQAVLPAETQTVLLDRAGGNPLYAEEFVRMLSDRGVLTERGALRGAETTIPVPETIQGVIGARLDLLTEPETALLQAASVVGKVFWDGALRVVMDTEPGSLQQALRRLVEREVIRPSRTSSIEGQNEYTFWHLLTRDVAYGRIPRLARAQRHRAVAGWIEQIAGDRVADHAELLVHHYQQAMELSPASDDDVREAVIRALRLAGERASRLDVAKALEYYERALDLMSEDHLDRPATLFEAGVLAFDLGLRASELLQASADAYRAAGDRLGEGRALRWLSTVQWAGGGTGAASTALFEAVRLLEQEAPSLHLTEAYHSMAGWYLFQGQAQEAKAWSEKALGLAIELGGDLARSRALQMRGMARFYLDSAAEGLSDLTEAVEIARGQLPAGHLVFHTALVNLSDYLWITDGPARALEIQEQAIQLAMSRGASGHAAWSRAESLWALFDMGRWDEVLERADRLIDKARSQVGSWARAYKAYVLVWRGRLEEAAQLADDFLPA